MINFISDPCATFSISPVTDALQTSFSVAKFGVLPTNDLLEALSHKAGTN